MTYFFKYLFKKYFYSLCFIVSSYRVIFNSNQLTHLFIFFIFWICRHFFRSFSFNAGRLFLHNVQIFQPPSLHPLKLSNRVRFNVLYQPTPAAPVLLGPRPTIDCLIGARWDIPRFYKTWRNNFLFEVNLILITLRCHVTLTNQSLRSFVKYSETTF